MPGYSQMKMFRETEHSRDKQERVLLNSESNHPIFNRTKLIFFIPDSRILRPDMVSSGLTPRNPLGSGRISGIQAWVCHDAAHAVHIKAHTYKTQMIWNFSKTFDGCHYELMLARHGI